MNKGEYRTIFLLYTVWYNLFSFGHQAITIWVVCSVHIILLTKCEGYTERNFARGLNSKTKAPY